LSASAPPEVPRPVPLMAVFDPASIAIVGASDRPGSWTANIWRNLKASGFAGPLWTVNPGRSELWGEPCYATVADLPEPVEHLVIAVPRDQVDDVLRQAGARGVRGATIISSGFADTGTAEGVRLQAEIRETARAQGLRLIGPNCFGWVSATSGVNCMAYGRMPEPLLGPVALVSQSGGAVPLVLQACAERGIGTSLAVSIGNAADVSIAEVIRAACTEPRIEVIALLLESVDDWADFLQACRQARAAHRRVVAVKVGRSERGREASATHTGRLAGDFALFEAAFGRAGGILAGSLDEMVDVLDLLSSGVAPGGTRVKVLVTSGNLRALFLDEAEGSSLLLEPLSRDAEREIEAVVGVDASVANPLDAGFRAVVDDEVFGRVAAVLAGQPATDLLAVFGKLEDRFEKRYRALVDIAREAGVPVTLFGRVTSNLTEENRRIRATTGLPYVPTVRRLIGALESLARAAHAEAGDQPPRTEHRLRLAPDTVRRLAQAADQDGLLDHLASSALLADAGIEVVPQAQVADPEQAAEAAERLGYPVVAKLIAPGLSHKTEVGGVRVGLTGPDELSAACAELLALVPGDSRAGVSILVQPMVSGTEVIVGARTDRELGAFVVVGTGGVMAELLADAVTAAAPLGRAEAESMIDRTLVGRLASGYRGRPPLDVEALVDVVIEVGEFVSDNAEWIESLDLNPIMLRARGEGAVLVDARIAVRPVVAGQVEPDVSTGKEATDIR
jgi:acyl-CoA synthetase (NDP forming)